MIPVVLCLLTTAPVASAQPTFLLRNANTSGYHHVAAAMGGQAIDRPIVGDWNGDGITTIGIARSYERHLRNTNTTGVADVTFDSGDYGDIPIVGDWDGNGTDTLGLVRGNNWYVRNSNTTSTDYIAFTYGFEPGDIALVGDWNGDGTSTAGLYRPKDATWHVTNSPNNWCCWYETKFGTPGDSRVVVGDWDGNGWDSLGIVRADSSGVLMWYLKNSFYGEALDYAPVNYGIAATDTPIAGDWDGNGTDTPGVVRDAPDPSIYYPIPPSDTEYLTSWYHGGADHSVNNTAEVDEIVGVIQSDTVAGGDHLWWNLSPNDRAFVDNADRGSDPQQSCREAFWDDKEGYEDFCRDERLWTETDGEVTYTPSGVYPSGWNDLTSKERAYCRTHYFQCKRFQRDAKIAQKFARILFTGRGTEDNTRANAFKHSFWTALMTKSVGGESLQGFHFASEHEYSDKHDAYQYSLGSDTKSRRASRMDTINNRVGYWYVQQNQGASTVAICKYLYSRASSAAFLGVDPDPWAWYESHGYAADLSVWQPIYTSVYRRTTDPATGMYVVGESAGGVGCES
jgi:hypothetical protein